jgi:hypothetical protein
MFRQRRSAFPQSAVSAQNPEMTDFPRSRFSLPHWGWFLLGTVVLIIARIGLSIWLPYHREQQVIQRIEAWGGRVSTYTAGPKWLIQCVPAWLT